MYSLSEGLKKCGEKGQAIVHKEMKQLNDRAVFESIAIEQLTPKEKETFNGKFDISYPKTG